MTRIRVVQIAMLATGVVALCLVAQNLFKRSESSGRPVPGKVLRAWHSGGTRVDNRKFGFVDTAGNWRIPPRFQEVSEFAEDLALVRLNQEYFYISPNGAV